MQKLNTAYKNQTMQYTAKQNYPGLVAFYDTRSRNERCLFYTAAEPTRDHHKWKIQYILLWI